MEKNGQNTPQMSPASQTALASAEVLLNRGDLAGANNRIGVALYHQLRAMLNGLGLKIESIRDTYSAAMMVPSEKLPDKLKLEIKNVAEATLQADRSTEPLSISYTTETLMLVQRMIAQLIELQQLHASPIIIPTAPETIEAMPMPEPELPQADDLADKNFDTPEQKNRPIFVPWDFTELAAMAVKHAVGIARTFDRTITLLHIAKKDNEIPEIQKKLDAEAKKLSAENGLSINCMVKTGNIFTDISKLVDEHDAQLVVMGTHGLKGMQKITGSWALKVITDTKAPFIVIQDKPLRSKIEHVVLPITHVRDLKKVLNEVRLLEKYFSPTFHLVRTEKFPTDSHKKSVVGNFVFIKSFMKQNNIKFTDNEIGATKSVYEAALWHARKVQADMVMVLTTKDIQIQDYLMGAEEQKLIANSDKIPVMCVNPLSVYNYSIGSLMR